MEKIIWTYKQITSRFMWRTQEKFCYLLLGWLTSNVVSFFELYK